MNPAALFDKLSAILKRDLLTAVRYRRGFLITAIGTLAQLASFYYLSRAVGSGYRPEGMSYFPFLVVGTGVYTFMVMTISACLQTIQEAQQNGTLEVLMISSTSAPVLLLLSAVSVLVANTLQLVVYVEGGLLLFRSPAHNVNMSACLVIFALSLIIAIGFGLLAAALQISIQKGSAMLWLFGSGAWLISGTLFPVATLPRPLRVIAEAIPITHSLDGLRLALLDGASFARLLPDIRALAFFAFALLPVGMLAFSFAVRRSRQLGTLSFY
jgi:ABC-type polysaccharide/polyol phosphate export permease